MSLDDLNREQKRQLKRQGALDEQGAPTRAPRQQAPARTGRPRPVPPRGSRRDAQGGVAEATEVVRYSIIVTATVVVYTAFVGGLDYGLQYVADWFYA